MCMEKATCVQTGLPHELLRVKLVFLKSRQSVELHVPLDSDLSERLTAT